MELLSEDGINVEDLQAQIDLSMSFAQNLVSSWVKPHKNGSNSRRRALESELLESIRRPPRLGVGTVASDAQSTSRETVRLKGQLTGKKRLREDGGNRQPDGEIFEDNLDEDESRACSIKKKMKVDPFDTSKKKTKKQINGPIAAPMTTSTSHAEVQPPREVSGEEFTSSPKSLKNKKKPKQSPDRISSEMNNPNTPPPGNVQLTNAPSTPSPTTMHSKTTNVLSIFSATAPKTPQQNMHPSSPKINQHTPIAPSVSTSTPKTQLPAHLVNKPLLNLRPSPSDTESEEDLPRETASASPKKKRRRRKKKKIHPLV